MWVESAPCSHSHRSVSLDQAHQLSSRPSVSTRLLPGVSRPKRGTRNPPLLSVSGFPLGDLQLHHWGRQNRSACRGRGAPPSRRDLPYPPQCCLSSGPLCPVQPHQPLLQCFLPGAQSKELLTALLKHYSGAMKSTPPPRVLCICSGSACPQVCGEFHRLPGHLPSPRRVVASSLPCLLPSPGLTSSSATPRLPLPPSMAHTVLNFQPASIFFH